ncbi:hypothetical protein Tco_1089458 [Tanacetum coccineum]
MLSKKSRRAKKARENVESGQKALGSITNNICSRTTISIVSLYESRSSATAAIKTLVLVGTQISLKDSGTTNYIVENSVVHPNCDQDDPHDDAHPEGENSAKRQKTSEYEAYDGVNKCVKKFNPYARYGVEHWKNPHAKIFYIKKRKEPGKPKERKLGHEHKFITEIVARRANECIVSITEPDYKNLNKNDIEDMYLLIMNGKVPDYAETGRITNDDGLVSKVIEEEIDVKIEVSQPDERLGRCYVSLIRKKFCWGTIFPIELKRYSDPKEEPIENEPLMKLKEIG